MSTTDVVDQNTQLLLAMLHIYHPSRDDCNQLAAAMGTGVTGNAIRQRIQKLRKNHNVADSNNKNNNNGGDGGSVSAATTPAGSKAGTPSKATAAGGGGGRGGGSRSGSRSSPTKKNGRGGGGGRKRVQPDDVYPNDSDDLRSTTPTDPAPTTAAFAPASAFVSAAKKKANANANKKIKQEEEPEEDVKIVASVIPAVPADDLIDQGSFFFLQDEGDDDAVV